MGEADLEKLRPAMERAVGLLINGATVQFHQKPWPINHGSQQSEFALGITELRDRLHCMHTRQQFTIAWVAELSGDPKDTAAGEDALREIGFLLPPQIALDRPPGTTPA